MCGAVDAQLSVAEMKCTFVISIELCLYCDVNNCFSLDEPTVRVLDAVALIHHDHLPVVVRHHLAVVHRNLV